MNLNKVEVIGRMTRDPETKALPSGTSVTNFSLGTNRVWKDKAGVKQEEAEFINCVAFGRTAEVMQQYVRKGQEIYIEGRLQTRSWDDKESGKKVYRTEVIVNQMQMGAKAKGDTGERSSYQKPAGSVDAGDTIEYPDEDINPDDIPF